MTKKIKWVFASAAALAVMSCSNSTTSTDTKTDTSTSQRMNSTTDTMDKKMSADNMSNMSEGNDLMGAMKSMMDKMSGMKMSGDFDMDFANMMIEHHQGAIDMSEAELKSGTDEKMKAIAQSTITKQKEEQAMLRDIVKNNKPMKMEMGGHDELSKNMDDMKAKMGSMKMSGNTDKDFAAMMISHHEDAIKMSKDEMSHGMNDKLKEMAKKGIADQTKEIGEFKSWLATKQ